MRFLSWLMFLLALVLAGVVAFLVLATSSQPEIERPATLNLIDLERGRILVQSLDLRHLKEGEERRLRFADEDLERALNWAIGSLGRGGADVASDRDGLRVRASVRLYTLPRYLNLSLGFQPEGDLLVPSELRLGRVPLPARFTGRLLGALLALSPAAEQYRVVRGMLNKASVAPGRLELTLVWHGAALQQAMKNAGWTPAGLLAADLEAYHERLAATPGHDYATLLGAVFDLARERSQQGDPVAENRNAIAALAETAIGGRLFIGQGERKSLRKRGARLAGREDSAQHFSLSAFIAITGGEGVADLAGLYKETRDAKHGSGFSFNDLAADKAGSRFGELATRSPESARRVQQRLAGKRDPGMFYPAAKDLPESMNQSQFLTRFGGVGAPAYVSKVQEIEARIANLPLYREE